jgi:adenylate kinase
MRNSGQYPYAQPQVLVLLGPPGVGKGTQGELLARQLGIPAISTGEMLRSELAAGTTLGEQIRECVAGGGLVSDVLMQRLVKARISQKDCINGFLLDGFPRSVPQARFLTALLTRLGLPQVTVLHLEASREELVRRLGSRRYCPECKRTYALDLQSGETGARCATDGCELARRADDAEEVIGERLRTYDQITAPVVAYYRGFTYFRVDGSGSPSSVAEELACLVTSDVAVTAAG